MHGQQNIKKVWIGYVEMKSQLVATDGSLLQNLLFAQHISGTNMPIIRSSRVLYRWLLPVVLGALVYRLLVWCGAVGYVPGLRDAAKSPRPTTCKPKHQVHLAATTCIILLSS